MIVGRLEDWRSMRGDLYESKGMRGRSLMQRNKRTHSIVTAWVPTPILYRYLVVHIVYASTIWRRRTLRHIMRGTLRVLRRHLDGICHFECPNERHRPPSVIYYGKDRSVGTEHRFPMHLRASGWGVNGHAPPHGWMIGPRWWRSGVWLLRGTSRVRSVEVRMVLGGRWITGWGVFPHVNASLRRVGQLPDVIDRVVRSRVG